MMMSLSAGEGGCHCKNWDEQLATTQTPHAAGHTDIYHNNMSESLTQLSSHTCTHNQSINKGSGRNHVTQQHQKKGKKNNVSPGDVAQQNSLCLYTSARAKETRVGRSETGPNGAMRGQYKDIREERRGRRSVT